MELGPQLSIPRGSHLRIDQVCRMPLDRPQQMQLTRFPAVHPVAGLRRGFTLRRRLATCARDQQRPAESRPTGQHLPAGKPGPAAVVLQ